MSLTADGTLNMSPTELTEARRALHLSQIGLAHELGVAANTVNRWEMGTRAIPPYLGLALLGIRCRAVLGSAAPALHLWDQSRTPGSR